MRLGFNIGWQVCEVRLQYWVASLCNQPLPEFSRNQFETLHRCYKHIEDVHAILLTQFGDFDYGVFEIGLEYRVASLCSQLLPEFKQKNETLHRCYKYTEDVPVTFCRRKKEFLTKLPKLRP